MTKITCQYYIKHKTKSTCEKFIEGGFCSSPHMFRCIEFESLYEYEISYSSMNAMVKCPRYFYLSRLKGIEKKEKSDALLLGSFVDDYINNYVSAKNPDDIDVSIDSMWKAKGVAMIRAMLMLNILHDDLRNKYVPQKKFRIQQDGMPKIKGYIDLAADDHIIEIKASKRPEIYYDQFMQEDQYGTYLLADDNYKYIKIWAIRVPDLKQTARYKDESFQSHSERCLNDIMSRPTHYFYQLDQDMNGSDFGDKFMRDELDLENLKQKYKFISKELRQCKRDDYWYQRKSSCNVPFRCDMYYICENGHVPDSLYKIRERRDSNNGNDKVNT